VARTVASSAAIAALATWACGGATSSAAPPPAQPQIDYVDGAGEPILLAGEGTVIEGFGFGTTPGTVKFPSAAGAITAPVAAGDWTDGTIRVTVPDSAVSGSVSVTTAGGAVFLHPIHVVPAAAFDPTTLTWQARSPFPRAPVGVALATLTAPAGTQLAITLYAVGGGEPVGGDSGLVVDSGVYVAQVVPGGATTAWQRQRDTSVVSLSRVLPVPRAYAATAIGNRYNSRFVGPNGMLYVIGGLDGTDRATATVFSAPITSAGVAGAFTSRLGLPDPVAGAIAVVRRGRIYVMGGADTLGHPQNTVYMSRINPDGSLDGWYTQPALPGPRAYGGGVVLNTRLAAFGGIADSTGIGGGLDPTPTRLTTADTSAVSLLSGFFSGAWGAASPPLADGRSQFALLNPGKFVLAVGGMYAGATTNSAETLVASTVGDSLGSFSGPVGSNTIAGIGGGTLIGPAGIGWRDADGTAHGLVLGGIDLATRLRRGDVWGF
jgi:hypothetical protein